MEARIVEIRDEIIGELREEVEGLKTKGTGLIQTSSSSSASKKANPLNDTSLEEEAELIVGGRTELEYRRETKRLSQSRRMAARDVDPALNVESEDNDDQLSRTMGTSRRRESLEEEGEGGMDW